ncbi:hypothetical protein N0V90_011151 [Kalmusia sp. IMI 367209]|nr:hypothetical protein N0V90_011151 [Kalmusia sp. IMI 367209]
MFRVIPAVDDMSSAIAYYRIVENAIRIGRVANLLPNRWADGVAVRGKLKGKSQPVIEEGKAINLVRNSVQQQAESALQQAAHLGLHPSDNCCNEVVADESQLMQIMAYYNSTICSERVSRKETKFIERSIAPLNQEYARQLPRSIVNCLLGISAVHMASRNPGNTSFERLALETKVNVFQSHNQLLRMPQSQLDQRPDVVISCGILIFAMDLFEHGMSRWMVHTLGSMHVMSSFGGIENLAFYYPHMHVPLLHVSLFETMWIITSHVPLTKPKQTSRNALELLLHSHFAKSKIFNGCPTPLTLAVWDTAACAQKVFGDGGSISFADMHKRERILMDVLSFQPEDGSRAVKDDYYHHVSPVEAQLEHWDLVGAIWKAAITILVLRYIYFGRPELVPISDGGPSLITDPTGLLSSFIPDETLGAYYQGAEEPSNVEDYLTAGTYYDDPLSRSPSPMPSPHVYVEPPQSNMWDARYDIHNEAFNTLASILATFQPHLEPISLRCILVPVIVLALVSRRNSKERALSMDYFARFDEIMTSPSASPIGGEKLELDIPWDKLDACSEIIEAQSRGVVNLPMSESAPEWNWWDMLKHIDLNLSWPVTAGHSHLERGSEFWAFKLISSVANEECFNVWLQDPDPTPSQASTSSA